MVRGADRGLSQTQVAFKALARVLMDLFGLSLDSPLVPNVDAYINPAKDEDAHRRALNAVVSTRLFSSTHYATSCPPIYYFNII